MSMLTNFRLKVRQFILCLLFFSAIATQTQAQNCPAPTGLSKDSSTVTHVYYSWQAVTGARGYRVTYFSPSTSYNQVIFGNTVSFAKSTQPAFEVFTVSSICSQGDESEPVGLIDGGIVVTVDIIFRMPGNCDNPPPGGNPEYLFFADLCMYTQFEDLCEAIDAVNNPAVPTNDPLPVGSQEWLEAVLHEMESGNYLWQPWDNPEGCMEPLRLSKPRPAIQQLGVSPNPFQENFSLELYLEDDSPLIISLYDGMGRRLEERQYKPLSKGYQQIGRLGGQLSPGIYYLHVQTRGQQHIRRMIKI